MVDLTAQMHAKNASRQKMLPHRSRAMWIDWRFVMVMAPSNVFALYYKIIPLFHQPYNDLKKETGIEKYLTYFTRRQFLKNSGICGIGDHPPFIRCHHFIFLLSLQPARILPEVLPHCHTARILPLPVPEVLLLLYQSSDTGNILLLCFLLP